MLLWDFRGFTKANSKRHRMNYSSFLLLCGVCISKIQNSIRASIDIATDDGTAISWAENSCLEQRNVIYFPKDKWTLCCLLSQILFSLNLEEESCGQIRITLTSYSRDPLFETRPGGNLSWLRYIVGLSVLLVKWQDSTLNYYTAASFRGLSSSLYRPTNHPFIKRYMVWATENVVE
jgi:hypothetical protein